MNTFSQTFAIASPSTSITASIDSVKGSSERGHVSMRFGGSGRDVPLIPLGADFVSNSEGVVHMRLSNLPAYSVWSGKSYHINPNSNGGCSEVEVMIVKIRCY